VSQSIFGYNRLMSEEISPTKADQKSIRKKAREQTIGYIVGAFGLVAGLAWNDAVKAFIEYAFPMSAGGGLAAKFVYALLITLAVVVITTYLSRLTEKEG